MREVLRFIHSPNPRIEAEWGYRQCEKLTKGGERCARQASSHQDSMARTICLCGHHREEILAAAAEANRGGERIEKRLLAVARRNRSVVYFVRRKNGDIKIGYTAKLPERLASLRHEHGHLEVLATGQGAREAEHALHERFADFRIGRTEWFRPRARLLRFVASVAAMSEAA